MRVPASSPGQVQNVMRLQSLHCTGDLGQRINETGKSGKPVSKSKSKVCGTGKRQSEGGNLTKHPLHSHSSVETDSLCFHGTGAASTPPSATFWNIRLSELRLLPAQHCYTGPYQNSSRNRQLKSLLLQLLFSFLVFSGHFHDVLFFHFDYCHPHLWLFIFYPYYLPHTHMHGDLTSGYTIENSNFLISRIHQQLKVQQKGVGPHGPLTDL